MVLAAGSVAELHSTSGCFWVILTGTPPSTTTEVPSNPYHSVILWFCPGQK